VVSWKATWKLIYWSGVVVVSAGIVLRFVGTRATAQDFVIAGGLLALLGTTIQRVLDPGPPKQRRLPDEAAVTRFLRERRVRGKPD
jgi:hypothetical protein